MKKLFFLILIQLLFIFSLNKKTIFIIGDSTAANRNINIDKVKRGWGQMFQMYFDQSEVEIKNEAKSSQTSRSFINDGHWAKVKVKLKKGDYVLIQFGANENKRFGDYKNKYTLVGSTFDQYLTIYAREIKLLGAIPVLMSPVVKRVWDKNGNLVNTLGKYREAAKKVASETNSLFIDANKITEDLEKYYGVEGSKKLHMIYKPGEEPSLPNGVTDNIHYNIFGAVLVARLFAIALGEVAPELKPYLKTDVIR